MGALWDGAESMGVVMVCGHSRVLETGHKSAILEPGRTGFGVFGKGVRFVFIDRYGALRLRVTLVTRSGLKL